MIYDVAALASYGLFSPFAPEFAYNAYGGSIERLEQRLPDVYGGSGQSAAVTRPEPCLPTATRVQLQLPAPKQPVALLPENAESLAARGEVAALTKFYPENAGFSGGTERTFLMPGQIIDRYGGTGYSRFFSPQGTPDWARSLPPGTAGQPLRTFEVVKPFEVQLGKVAPLFNQPGGGIQYMTPVRLEILLKRGIIKEITP